MVYSMEYGIEYVFIRKVDWFDQSRVVIPYSTPPQARVVNKGELAQFIYGSQYVQCNAISTFLKNFLLTML